MFAHVGILTTKSGGMARNYHYGECINAAAGRLNIGTSDSLYTRRAEVLRILYDGPEMQEVGWDMPLGCYPFRL